MDLKTGQLTRRTFEAYNEHALLLARRQANRLDDGLRQQRSGTDYWLMNTDGSNKRRLRTSTRSS